jgi:hypothetical protein
MAMPKVKPISGSLCGEALGVLIVELMRFQDKVQMTYFPRKKIQLFIPYTWKPDKRKSSEKKGVDRSLEFFCSMLTTELGSGGSDLQGSAPCQEPANPLSYWTKPCFPTDGRRLWPKVSPKVIAARQTRLRQPYERYPLLLIADLNDPPSHAASLSRTVVSHAPFFRHASHGDLDVRKWSECRETTVAATNEVEQTEIQATVVVHILQKPEVRP